MKKLSRTFLATAAWLAGLAVAQGYLLDNSFYDELWIDWNDGAGWEAYGDPTGGDAVGQHDWANGAPGSGGAYGQDGDGNYGLAFQAWASTYGGFYQDVPVEAGSTYTFQIEAHFGCNSPGGDNWSTDSVFRITFDWYDADPDAGGILVAGVTNELVTQDGGCDGDPFDDYTVPFNWTSYDESGVAPAGAVVLRMGVSWDGYGQVASGGSEAVRWDNALLTVDTLGPANESLEPTDDLFAISFNTQSTVTYRLESSTDLGGWVGTVHPPVVGDDMDHTLYDLPGDPMAAWRLVGSQPAAELVNGDFEAADDGGGPAGWTTWTDGGWANREINAKLSGGPYTAPNSGLVLNGVYDGSFQMALGGAGSGPGGAYQIIVASPGVDYTVSVQGGVDDWWLPTSEIRLIFLDPAEAEVERFVTSTTDSLHDPDLYDWGVPYTNWSLTATAPAGTAMVKVELAEVAGTGSVWFDNVVFTNSASSGPPPPPVPNDVALGQTDSVLISFDGHLGTHYQLDYSEDAGATWFETLHPVVVGEGTRQSVYDPEGPSVTRQYQLRVVPDALPPAP